MSNIWSLLSRKFILTALFIVLGIWFININLISEATFTWIMMATVVSYVVGKGIDMARLPLSKQLQVSLMDRLKALFNREFIVAVGIVFLMSYLLKAGKITDTSWSVVIMTIGPVYNIVNPFTKN